MMICKQNFLIFSLSFLFFPLSDAGAKNGEFCGAPKQGEIWLAHVPGYVQLINGKTSFPVNENGDVLVAFEREAEEGQDIKLVSADGKNYTQKILVMPTRWDIQNIKGVPSRKVTPAPADEKAIVDERLKVRGALGLTLPELYWHSGFIQPVKGRISGRFGGQRIMNGKKMNPHGGTDIAAPQGTKVVAAGDGIVTLAAPNLFYSGNVVIIDHGYGLQTVYAHLNKIGVEAGQKVSKGEIIGEVGMTGRVTGPHLHWGASVQGIRIDPFSLLKLPNSPNTFCYKSNSFTK